MSGSRARRIVPAAALGIGIAAGAAIALRPSTFRVERSIHVEAPAARVAAPIRDLDRWLAWSEREGQDPGARRTHGGPEAGAGASVFWSSSDGRGGGRLTVVSDGPDRWVLERETTGTRDELVDLEIALAPEGNGTRVTWVESGTIPILARLLPARWRADGAVPGQVERSLQGLATVAESEARVAIDEVEREVRTSAGPAEIQAALADLRRWPEFWPLPAHDPESPPVFSGAPGAPGSSAFWQAGRARGRITLLSASADRVVVEVESGRAEGTPADLSFRLLPEGSGTRIVVTASAPAARDVEVALERLARHAGDATLPGAN